MFNLLTKLCDYVFPERSDHRIVRELEIDELKKLICPIVSSDFIYLLPFKDPRVRAIIHEAKFHHNEKAWVMLGEVLDLYFKHLSSEAIIVPIPLSSKRLRERGYNQVERSVRAGLKPSSMHRLRSDILFRKRHTLPQTSLPKEHRLRNVHDVFAVSCHDSVLDADIIVIDDVATTGATLKAAKAALLTHHPSKITLLAIAH